MSRVARAPNSLESRRAKAAPPEIADEDDTLTMKLSLASGRFESSISIPLFSSDDEKKRFVESWINLMDAGLKCGSGRRKP